MRTIPHNGYSRSHIIAAICIVAVMSIVLHQVVEYAPDWLGYRTAQSSSAVEDPLQRDCRMCEAVVAGAVCQIAPVVMPAPVSIPAAVSRVSPQSKLSPAVRHADPRAPPA